MWRTRVLELYQRMTQTPAFELPVWQRRVAAVVLVLKHCAPRISSIRSQQMAAALTYHTVFSLLPTIVLVLITQQTFLEPDDRAAIKARLVDILLEPITSEYVETRGEQAIAIDDSGSGLTEDQRRRLEFKQYRLVMEKEVTAVLERLESVSFGGIGFFGLLLFLYGTTGLLTTIESTFDEVFCAHRVRPAYRRIPVYYAILTLGPLVMLAGQWAQNRLLELIGGGWTAWLAGPLLLLSPVLSVWLLLYAMFVFMPTTRVSPRAAALGSFISALFWVAGIELFELYISRAAITSLYGALALFPLSLFFLFITWQLLLLGMEVTYSVQVLSETGRLPKELSRVVTPSVLSPGWTLEIAARIGAAFKEGQVVSIGRLQRSTGLPRAVTQSILDGLCQADIIHEVDERLGYGLARPAESITVDDLLEIHRVRMQRDTLVRIDSPELHQRFRDGGRAELGHRSLGHLIEALEAHVPPSAEPQAQRADDAHAHEQPPATQSDLIRLHPVGEAPVENESLSRQVDQT